MDDLKRAAAVLAGAVVALGATGSWRGTADALPSPACDVAGKPFCNSIVPLPAGWTGHVFKLSQTYPQTAPQDTQPWLAFDPTTQPDAYIRAILAYFYDGNVRPDLETSFDPPLNTKRHWYHAPWQDFGTNGREPLHGLTRERVSRPGELAPQQTKAWNNYAVGFYNAPGGVTIGKVWANHGTPDASAGRSMPEGTVAAKLLFTTAPVSQAPYLKGSPTWKAYIYADPNNPAPKATSPRAVLTVRLLQIDVAVKDSRVAGKTGWVFGTFVYGGGPGGPVGSGWTNVAPVGLMWGNDPGYSGTGPLKESWINPAVHMPHLGFQGRLNGPVDNKASACLSCHATAEAPGGAMIPSNPVARWFQNLPSGTPFDAGRKSLDYSLQLAVGLDNFAAARKIATAPSMAARSAIIRSQAAAEARPARDGGPTH